jgi:hypothetical protein
MRQNPEKTRNPPESGKNPEFRKKPEKTRFRTPPGPLQDRPRTPPGGQILTSRGGQKMTWGGQFEIFSDLMQRNGKKRHSPGESTKKRPVFCPRIFTFFRKSVSMPVISLSLGPISAVNQSLIRRQTHFFPRIGGPPGTPLGPLQEVKFDLPGPLPEGVPDPRNSGISARFQDSGRIGQIWQNLPDSGNSWEFLRILEFWTLAGSETFSDPERDQKLYNYIFEIYNFIFLRWNNFRILKLYSGRILKFKILSWKYSEKVSEYSHII